MNILKIVKTVATNPVTYTFLKKAGTYFAVSTAVGATVSGVGAAMNRKTAKLNGEHVEGLSFFRTAKTAARCIFDSAKEVARNDGPIIFLTAGSRALRGVYPTASKLLHVAGYVYVAGYACWSMWKIHRQLRPASGDYETARAFSSDLFTPEEMGQWELTLLQALSLDPDMVALADDLDDVRTLGAEWCVSHIDGETDNPHMLITTVRELLLAQGVSKKRVDAFAEGIEEMLPVRV